ncbi:MAG: ABC transporter permease [Deltaproteobacteria bacterium]|nr:ABC transporter permease [Deltaproteobacteria bacterium]
MSDAARPSGGPLARFVPLVLLLLGAAVLLVRGLLAARSPHPFVSVALLLGGGALVAVGGIGLALVVATRRSFEWFLAWRYLRARGGRRWVTLAVGLGLLGVGVALLLAAKVAGRPPVGELVLGPTRLQRGLEGAAVAVFLVANWVVLFGLLLLAFSLFTSVAVFGVYLGTCALVVVLSVMGGFEQDLRRKILGTRAHVVVSRHGQPFVDYRPTLGRVGQLPGVTAAAPFVEAEVMLSSQNNISGVVLRGIDPQAVGRVSELPAYLRAEGGAGNLGNLVHPERLAKIPATPFRAGLPPLRDVDEDADRTGEGDKKKGDPLAQSPKAGPAGAKRAAPAGKTPRAAEEDDDADEADDGEPAPVKVPPRPVYPGIIVGAELAKNLRLYVGDDVNLVSPLGGMSPAGPIPKARPFRVAGIFYSGMYEYDTKLAYITIPAAQRFLGLEDEVTALELKVANVDSVALLADELRRRLGSGYEVKDWQQLNRNLFSALKLERVVMFAVLTFIVVVAAFAIIITLTMLVLEKRREIAVLKALGAGHRALLRVFVIAGVYIGLIGMAMGVLEGLTMCTYVAYVGLPLDPEVYYISRLPVRMNPWDIGAVAGAAVTLSLLGTLYPAFLASSLKPVEGLRYDD